MTEKLTQVIEILKLQDSLSSVATTTELYDDNATVVYADCKPGIGKIHSIGDGNTEDRECVLGTLGSGVAKRVTDIDSFGKKIECNYVAVYDGADVVGCIVTKQVLSGDDAANGTANEKAIEKAEIFMDCIDKINNSIDTMSIHFENLFEKLQAMQEKAGFISKGVEETSGIVSKIRANASKSKILALNASIEAARSGEAGRGFTVVAKEMGEMATASGTSASDINDSLKSIFSYLDEVTTAIDDANGLAEKQTGSIKEIEECLQGALEAAQQLGEALQA